MPKIHCTFRPWDSWTRRESKGTCSLVDGRERNFSYLPSLGRRNAFSVAKCCEDGSYLARQAKSLA
jgi:hypothetical protein